MVCKHQHDFYIPEGKASKRVLIVLILTFITMLLEIFAGYLFNSVALLADGIHMSTHALAFAIAYLAYYLAKGFAKDKSFTFGTWKIEVLGAYSSGILLFFVSFLILIEALSKLFQGGEIKYQEALLVAFLGLFVNLLSAYILHGEEHKHDLNLLGAYLHVLADALTSLLAIAGLLAGKFLGWWFMDPLMGLVGFFVIVRWSYGLVKETIPLLLDKEGKNPLGERIIEKIEKDGKSRVYDIHLLRVGRDAYACILGIETKENLSVEYYEELLKDFENIVHATLEVRLCGKE
ncbi:MAG: cation diffusion facilitator family transporter [Aquificaceae bacterium]